MSLLSAQNFEIAISRVSLRGSRKLNFERLSAFSFRVER